jgi:predicted RND superfamily exporter protein
MIFIAMGIFGVWLDMATAMIASVAVGVAVDDTIHIYHGFKRRVQAGRGPVLAVVRTFRQAGRAVIATTLVLCAQLVMLGGSDFVPTAEFGLLTALGLAVAILFDILFFPAVLILLHTRERPARAGVTASSR